MSVAVCFVEVLFIVCVCVLFFYGDCVCVCGLFSVVYFGCECVWLLVGLGWPSG